MSILEFIGVKAVRPALAIAFLGGVLLASNAPAVAADAKVHRLAIHVDSSDPNVQNLALNNVENVSKYYKDHNSKVMIEVVALGPGLHMLRSDTSKVKSRIETMSLANDNVTFSACLVTRGKMARKEKKEIPIIPEARKVPSGVIRLIELQEQGWSYIRP